MLHFPLTTYVLSSGLCSNALNLFTVVGGGGRPSF